jgi:hypothetical protein
MVSSGPEPPWKSARLSVRLPVHGARLGPAQVFPAVPEALIDQLPADVLSDSPMASPLARMTAGICPAASSGWDQATGSRRCNSQHLKILPVKQHGRIVPE